MLRLENYNNGLIYTEVKGCIDCNKCIHECPILKSNVSVMYDDSSYKMCVDEKECILCGTCLDTCIHDVRHYRDDCGQFFEDLERGRNLSVIIAPAFRYNYPDEYKNILGYLKSCGVKNFYPVSFGADIAVWGYLNYITRNKGRGHIAPPCPSIVRHIEKHLPELLPKLIPIQTPMLCTAVYLKKYKGVQEDLVLLSPCIAKKAEIESERGRGLVSHNITFRNLMTHIKEQGVNLSAYHCDEGEDDGCGIGALFPKPGGLRENIEYYMGREAEVIQIEGEHKAYKYLDFLVRSTHKQDAHVPMLVDILNCEQGCLYGTGTELHKVDTYDAIYQAIVSRKKKFDAMKDSTRVEPADSAGRFALLNEKFKDLRLEDFMCGYAADEDINRTPAASDEEIENIFNEKLMKLTENDKHVDCAACGYDTCRHMAEAIALGINHHDNCVYYTKSALAKSMEELHAMEDMRLIGQRLKAVIDTSPMLCSVFDENLDIVDINQAGVTLLELPDKQAYFDQFYELCPEYQSDGTPSRDVVRQLLTVGFEQGSITKFEWEHQTLNSKTLIPCEGYLERVELGEKRFVLAYLRDLREQKAMLAKLEDAISSEQAANAAKSKFLSNMSHEIRTPMNSVLGITELQLQKDTHTPETEEAFRRIYNSSNMLLSIINDILDLSKVEAGKMEIIPAVYEIASMIADTIQLNLMYIGSKIIEFKLYVDERLPTRLIGDELRIKQILNNLLSNAFKYTSEGVVSLSFEMEAATEDDVRLIIRVYDSGQGMTEEQVAELFGDEFTRFSLQENRAIEGSGLGLVITDRLIRMMGGEISVESQPGVGSVFTVTLPQKKIDRDILGKEAADKLQDLEYFQQSMERIDKLEREPMPYGRVLVVDDVESNLYVAKVFMMPYKIAIDTADSGEAAISKVRDGHVYDVIFMDYMMPGMDGVEATGHLRDMGYKHPVVALTADAVVGQADVLLSSGFDDYISKPVDIRQLDSILNKLVRDKQPPEVLEAARAQAAEMQAESKELNEPTEDHTTPRLLSGKAIDGLDIGKGLERYGGNEEIYLKILQSYSRSMRSIIEPIEAFDQANLIDYKIKVHGASGASFDIFATNIGTAAKALENAAIDGDVNYINTHNAPFVSDLRKLLDDVDDMLTSIDAEKPKADVSVKDKPDAHLLETLINACKVYDMSTVDDVVAEIEKYQYESDPDLAGWLRENADAMNFEQIIDRLS